MRQPSRRHLVGALVAGLVGLPLYAQPTPPAVPVGPAVGEMAPDFEFTGITRYGVLNARHKLSDYRGSTVVLAFFPKARTKG